MMSLTFGLFTQVSGSGPLGPLVLHVRQKNLLAHIKKKKNIKKLTKTKIKIIMTDPSVQIP